jgi:phospholipid transport system substrate-binding protein
MKGSSSFLKKRTKRLLISIRQSQDRGYSRDLAAGAGIKVFLLLFLQKKKTLLLSLPAALLMASAGWSFAAESDPSAAPIATLDQALRTAMKHGSQPFPSRYEALAPAVDGAFNLPQILKTTVGLRWASISPDQQKVLLNVFRAYTIANYAANFDSDSGDQIRILPETRSVGSDKVVETEIVPTTGDPIRIDYVMRQGPSGWQAVDVLETGTISQVAVQRSDFRTVLEGGADKLIDSLKAKVDKLSGGTVHP